MDIVKSTSDIIKLIYAKRRGEPVAEKLVSLVCAYFDERKGEELTDADLRFLRYIATEAGIPQYYEMLNNFQPEIQEREMDVHLGDVPTLVSESTLYTSEYIQLHVYQHSVLSRYVVGVRNRYFLSASTSFGKTYLVYEILRKMQYDNICLIFPTIALLSENIQKIYSNPEYMWVKDKYKIHTLSDTELQDHYNLFIYTPERFLSFMDKQPATRLDFLFVDEVYKIDNEFLVDEEQVENERDVAYRISTHIGLTQTEDCLLAGPYIDIDTNDASSSIVRFLNWADIQLLDFNKFEIVGKQEYNLRSRMYLDVPEFGQQIKFTSTGKVQRLRELVSHLVSIGENVIIYCPKKTSVEKYAAELLDGDYLQDIALEPLNTFLEHLENMFANRKGANWIVTKALKKGVGVHHGLVPKYIQNEIIRQFNNGVLKVLVVTTTITEGVNTTAKNMVVLSHSKGHKRLKTFDAKNIEGRAGRFFYHYTGRIFILDEEFKTIVDSKDEPLKHKFFDNKIQKHPVDFPYVDEGMLTDEESSRKRHIDQIIQSNAIPSEIIDSYKTISPEEKIHLYESLRRMTESEHAKIRGLISSFNGTGRISKQGFDVVCEKIKPIATGSKEIVRLIELRKETSQYCTLTNMVAVFLVNGFIGEVNYYSCTKEINEAARISAKFVFNTLRYQVVKYVGLFNLCYKHVIADKYNVSVDTVAGLDSLLMRMEYNAATLLGRKASDAGASFKVVDYYDKLSLDPETDAFEYLDAFEKQNANKIREIVTGNLVEDE